MHHALRSLGPAPDFTLNLRWDVEEDARGQPSPIDWLHRRIARELKAGLGRHVEFILTIEEADVFPPLECGRTIRRLHCHGELGISAPEFETARRCLRKAGGEWKENRQHQAKVRADPDAGWISYATKEAWRMTPFMRDLLAGSSLAASFDSEVLSATRDVSRQAKAIYDADRRRLVTVNADLRAWRWPAHA